MLSVGIVGLPNVGKSTLFNALLKKQQALAANYPFATIEPNIGVVPVPDERLQKLADITAEELRPHPDPQTRLSSLRAQASSSLRSSALRGEGNLTLPPIKPATVEFVDIAGLVKGASEGAGLGNKFLSHIREVKIIAHVVRAFEDPDVIKEGSIDPKSDYETIETELMLADVATFQNQVSRVKDHELKNLIYQTMKQLNSGVPIRDMQFSNEQKIFIDSLFLLSAKPEIIVLNVSEDQYNPKGIKKVTDEYSNVIANQSEPVKQSQQLQKDPAGLLRHYVPRNDGNNFVVICAKVESELSELTSEEQKQYLADLGLQESGLERLIKKAYQQLGLISFLTAGEKEVRAWTIAKGTNAQNAAGEIHTDFIKHFIKAEVVSYADFVSQIGRKNARTSGKARQEGRDYIVQDGDVIEFKIGK